MSDLLTGLNPAQRRAVQAGDGPVLVLAGPGSGKTRVLTHRIAHLIAAEVDPHQILAVTFTNKAAREMRERLEALIGHADAGAVTAGTFHSLCARFLRRDIHHLGRERDFVIYDSDDQERLMRRVLRELSLDEKKNPPRAIQAHISSAKNELVSPAEYARLNRASFFEGVVARCYERYQALLRESNALDFDDLLVEMVRLFELHPEVLGHYQRRYRHLLVDEYQDTNRAQYVLVRQLASGHRNLFVVGDSDQSIYQWRGADIRNILQFEDDYPDAQVILLEQNYRSTQAILDAAQAVISASSTRRHVKQLWTENGAGVQVVLQEGYDENEEARWVAEEIQRLIAAGEATPGDCAVMYRTNAQSRALEEALIARGLRYQLIGGTRFYDRKEIRDVLAYLRLAHNPYDSVSLGRVINWPGRGIGERSEAELLRWAAELGVPVFQALQELDEESVKAPFNSRARNALRGFLAIVRELNAARAELPLVELIDRLLERIQARAALQQEYAPEEADDRWNNVQELRNIAVEYINLPVEAQLPTFLEEVALVAEVDKLDGDADRVTCITLHQAKGLEYPVVFLIGLEEGLLPHSRSSDDRDKVDEERRLLFVGITRARRRLYMSYAFRRTSYGRTNLSTPSRFLADIPRELLKQPKRRGTAPAPQASMFSGRGGLDGGRSAPRAAPPTWESFGGRGARQPARGQAEVSFFAGQRVRHANFGDGVVVSSRVVDGDEEVTVSFADRERRLLASLARLERIE